MEKNKKPENPNAFPTRTEFDDSTNPIFSGMNLRDYFAAKAMQGMNPDEWTCIDELSKKSYQIADAMLLYREK